MGQHQANALFPEIMTTVDGRTSWDRKEMGTGASPVPCCGVSYCRGGCTIFICICIPPMSGLRVAMLMFV